MGKKRRGRKWQGIAGIPLSLLLIASLTSKTQQYKGAKGFCFLFFSEGKRGVGVGFGGRVGHSLTRVLFSRRCGRRSEFDSRENKLLFYQAKFSDQEKMGGGGGWFKTPVAAVWSATQEYRGDRIKDNWLEEKKGSFPRSKGQGEKATEGGGGEKD